MTMNQIQCRSDIFQFSKGRFYLYYAPLNHLEYSKETEICGIFINYDGKIELKLIPILKI